MLQYATKSNCTTAGNTFLVDGAVLLSKCPPGSSDTPVAGSQETGVAAPLVSSSAARMSGGSLAVR